MAEPGINLVHRGKHSCLAKWTVPYNPELQPNKMICSPWFEVGDFEFRSVIVPGSDALALGPDAFLSLQVKINSPRYSFRFGPLASYKLSILNHEDESKSLTKAFKLTLFTRNTNIPTGGSLQLASSVFGPRSGFFKNGSLHCSMEISILDESFSFSFSRDGNNDTEMVDYSAHSLGCDTIVLGGKFKWKIKNFSFFKEMIESRQQMSSAVFLLGRGFAHISASTTKVNGVECLSLFLEANQMHTCPKCMGHNKPSWCLFRISVLSQKAWRSHMHKDSYGRLNKTTPALGWTDYMKISDLIGPNNGLVMNNTVEFTVSFKAIEDSAAVLTSGFKEFGALNKSGSCTWKIESFTRLKDFLKNEKMIGVSVESRRYKKPIYLSIIIEASGPQDATQDWSCFARCRLSIVNKKNKDNSIFKETQGRFSEATKRWGWPEFLTLATLFNKGSGYLVEDTVMFNADILILKESLEIQDVLESSNKDGEKGRCTITWEMTNFLAFQRTSLMINDICSKYFQVDKLKLRIGVCVLSDNLCAFLACDPSDLVEDLYVRYKMTVVNKKHPAKSISKGSCLRTDTSDSHGRLLFMELSDMLKASAGFVTGEMATFVCEIFDYWPLLDLSKVPSDVKSHELQENGDNEDNTGKLLAMEGDHFIILKNEFRNDLFIMAGILIGMRLYHNTVKPNNIFRRIFGCIDTGQIDVSPDKFMSKLVDSTTGVESLHQQIENALLDVMVDCCQRLQGTSGEDAPDTNAEPCQDTNELKETDADFSMRQLVRLLHLFSPDDLIILSLPEFRIKHFVFQVLEAMCQLKLAIDVWKSVFLQASNVVDDLNGEALGAAIALLFKAASQCQDIPPAVSIVRQKLQRLGADVSPCVLDRLAKTLNSSDDLAVTMLQKIDSVFTVDQERLSSGGHGLATESLHAGGHHFSDIFMLLKMLAIPSIANQTMRAFEKGIANGFITHHLAEIEKWGSSYTERAFILVFGIAEKLLQSRRPPVLEFLRKFYSMLFKLFNDENYQKKMLRKLVDHAMSAANNCSKTSLDMLVFLVHKECKVAELVLSMARDDFQLANFDLSTLRSKLDTRTDEYRHVEEDLKTNLERRKIEESILLQCLREAEVTSFHHMTEMSLEMDRSTLKNKELSEKLQVIQDTLSKQKDKFVKLSNEKKEVVQEKNDLAKKLRITEADKNSLVEELRTEVEAQKAEQQSLSNEVQAVAQEKNDLAKKLRKTEADKNRFVEELRTEVEAQKAEQQSLSNEVQTLKQELRQIKREKQEKEEEIGRCKNYNDELEVKLNSLQAVAQEKNDLAEKLRTAEAEKKNLAEESRRLTSQNEAKEAARRSLLDGVHRLRQEKQKEEEIECYKIHNYELKQRLDISMGKIQSLENSLHEERPKLPASWDLSRKICQWSNCKHC
ncbi:hypothetical protein CXB51_014908 [Gossypium anomalum]|uniref:MATH domain-containing protein n=1 Tax=Gossypium anomalum TaxID=47600 RepID=A0A8J5Z0P0_9ROSI|nr:hypothetical protein CXB51_014908 [Gossypium anomalum]